MFVISKSQFHFCNFSFFSVQKSLLAVIRHGLKILLSVRDNPFSLWLYWKHWYYQSSGEYYIWKHFTCVPTAFCTKIHWFLKAWVNTEWWIFSLFDTFLSLLQALFKINLLHVSSYSLKHDDTNLNSNMPQQIWLGWPWKDNWTEPHILLYSCISISAWNPYLVLSLNFIRNIFYLRIKYMIINNNYNK